MFASLRLVVRRWRQSLKGSVALTDTLLEVFSHLSIGTSAWLLAQFPDKLLELFLVVGPFHESGENNASVLHVPQCQ